LPDQAAVASPTIARLDLGGALRSGQPQG
jgi:hypothetical protein